MTLTTPLPPISSPFSLSYSDRFLLLGSCFSDEMASHFSEAYLRCTSNPTGPLYNPLSILTLFNYGASCTMHPEPKNNRALCIVNREPINNPEPKNNRALCIVNREPSLCIVNPEPFYSHGLWHSFLLHSSFSRPTEAELLSELHRACCTLHRALSEATTLVVTFGSAYVYEREGQVVANCHKLPASFFTRRCLSVSDIVEPWSEWIAAHTNIRLILTVSPIRHLADGLHANQVSKGILLQSCDALVSAFPGRVVYFPSYEILMDELRDYRFYADDLVHPSSLAVSYIWDCFRASFFSPEAQADYALLHSFWLDSHHTLLHPSSPEALSFTSRLAATRAKLLLRFPWIN